MAWDFCTPAHLPLYIMAWRDIGISLVQNARDYVSALPVMLAIASK